MLRYAYRLRFEQLHNACARRRHIEVLFRKYQTTDTAPTVECDARTVLGKDLQEALQFAAEGKVKATTETQPLEAINDVFARLRKGAVQGRVVLRVA